MTGAADHEGLLTGRNFLRLHAERRQNSARDNDRLDHGPLPHRRPRRARFL